MLGPIVTAYEHAMTEGEGRNTWRTDRYSPCPRREASRYLTFLASIGYQLSGIEQAVADDVPWTGDEDPARPVPGNSGSDLPEGADDDARDVPWETDDAALDRRGEDQANASPEAA
jgi:ParB family chromosome partitioning protein